MSNPLINSVFRILDDDSQIAGTGFLVTPTMGVTCAHVVHSIYKKPGDELFVQFHLDKEKYNVRVEEVGWSSFEDGDIAFLRFPMPLLDGQRNVVLGKSEDSFGNDYLALGYPDFGDIESRWPRGKIGGYIRVHEKKCIDIQGQEIKEGMSGAPVLDLKNDRVIGMISFYQDEQKPPNRFAYAVPAEDLIAAFPSLHLWPSTYGPDEWHRYLNFLESVNGQLTLPDGRKVPLEKIYVSLRADEMNAAERKAEHDLYLQDVEKLRGQLPPASDDPYAEHNFLRRVISQHPRMQMLIARNWQAHFATRQNEKLNLAEVVQRHACVVLLGDPGSGKTTLGRWLSLQQSRALQNNIEQLLVPLDLVQPDFQSHSKPIDNSGLNTDEDALLEIQKELDSLKEAARSDGLSNADSYTSPDNSNNKNHGQIDLGSPRLPIFIRVAEYAHYRWQSDLDNGISLLDFISLGKHNEQILPRDLKPEAVGELCLVTILKGGALIILDGLDEVGNPDQRRIVMQSINDFIDLYVDVGNRLLLTSRIVGYQFHPLTHLPHYTVEDMDMSAIRAFCRAWMSHFYDLDDADNRGKRLADTILEHDHPGVKALAGNPLMLTLLAQVYRESGERALPHLRVDLFDETLHVLYKRREYLWDSKNITELRLARALAAVAYYLHSSEPAGFTDRGTIKSCLTSVLSDPDQVEEVLNVADEATGFLVSRGEGVYGFLHRAIQEYFAARYLVNEPDKTSSRLLPYVLDPAWREIVILGLGQVSQSRYPVTNRSEFIRKLWQDVLNFPDPAGEVLPRRALLLAMAVGECEQFPGDPLKVVVEQLLEVYGKRLAPVLQERIQRAFRSMQSGPAANIVEDALCGCLSSSQMDRRWGAIDLIIETKWYSKAIAHALTMAWVSFVDPAGALLVVLNDLHDRHPEYFTDDFLPFRLALKNNPSLWSRIESNVQWMTIVQSIYMRPGQKISVDDIWRESSLTPQILSRLNDGSSVEEWKSELISMSKLKNAPEGRDAVIVLAGLGDISQVEALSISDDLTPLYRPYLAGVLFMVGFDIAANLDFESIFDRSRALSLKIFQNSEQKIDQKVDKEIKITLDSAQDIARARDLSTQLRQNTDFDVANVIDIANDISHKFDLAFDISADLDLDSDREIVMTRALFVADRVIAHDINLNLERSRIRERLLERYLSSVRSDVKELQDALNFDEKQLKNMLIVRNLDLETDPNFDVLGAFNFDQNYYKIQKREKIVSDIKSLFDKMLSEMKIDVIVRKDLEDCFSSIHTLDAMRFDGWAKTGEQLISVMKDSRFYSRVEKAISSHVNLMETSIEDLVADLSNLEDTRRYTALQALQTSMSATQLGRERLEAIAKLAIQYKSQPQVGTQLEWSLHRIEFDCPDWIKDWIESLAITDVNFDESSDGLILSEIHKMSYDAFQVLMNALPHTSPQVNKSLLSSLYWQAYAGSVPEDLSSIMFEKLRNWMNEIIEPDIAEYLLEVIGKWRTNPIAAAQFVLEWSPFELVRSEWFAALGRLGHMIGTNNEIYWEIQKKLLQNASSDSSAAGGLARLLLGDGDGYLIQVQSFISDQEILLKAFLSAGTDNDVWSEEYHTVLVRSIQKICSENPEQLVPLLLNSLKDALRDQDIGKWPYRRITLAAVSACIEVMPTEMQKIAGGPQKLEDLLLDGSKDLGSFNSRRFAITSLGYLRVISSSVVPVLLSGLRENISIVQKQTFDAVSRFQRVQGDLLSELLPYLTIENAPATSYGVVKLLGALGVSPAAEIASIRPRIIQGLADAIRHPNSQQEVVLLKYSSSNDNEKIETESQGKLFEYLAQEMLRVAGWL